MRPRSIAGPVLLIVIGALFLLNNLNPDFRYLDMLALYWPYALIAWGVLRLVEVLVWQARSKPLPDACMRGGEWALIVLVCLLGSLFFFVNRHAWRDTGFMMRGAEMFGESFDYTLEEKKAAIPGKTCRIVIENLRGNARIAGSDAGEIRVNGRKTVRALTQGEADQCNKDTLLEMVQQGETWLIRTNQERATGNRRVSNDLEINVPKGASIEARGRLGDFSINDVNGDVDIHSENAGVRLQNIGGNVRVETRKSDIVRASGVKGSVDLRGRGQDLDLESVEGQVTITAAYYGDVQLRKLAKPLRMEASRSGTLQLEVAKLPGEIRMDLRSFTGDNLTGPVKLNAPSLDAQIGDFTQSLDISLERGDIELRPTKAPLGMVDARTRSGNIELSVPTGANFQLKATTRRGSIENDYGAPLIVEGKSRDEERNRKEHTTVLSGTVGQGPAVTLTTDRGTVTVRKASGENVKKTSLVIEKN